MFMEVDAVEESTASDSQRADHWGSIGIARTTVVGAGARESAMSWRGCISPTPAPASGRSGRSASPRPAEQASSGADEGRVLLDLREVPMHFLAEPLAGLPEVELLEQVRDSRVDQPEDPVGPVPLTVRRVLRKPHA